MEVQSQFIEMFGERSTTPVSHYIKDSFPGDWGKEDTDSTGVKVIRTTNFTNFGKLNLSEVVTRSIEEKKISKKQILKYDTILERSGGTTDNPVGRVVLFEEDEQYLCNNFTQVLRFKDIDPRFAFYALYYFYQMNKTTIRSMGSKTTGIQNLNMSMYLEIGIPNANEIEQKRFVSIAEQADKSKFVGFKSQFIEMMGDLETNPKGWKVFNLPEIASYSIGLTYKPEHVCEDGTIVLRSGNIQNGQIILDDLVRVRTTLKESLLVKEGDILMCSRNGSASLVGKVAQIKRLNEPMTYGAFMTIIRSEYSDFLYLYFQSANFREQISVGKSSTMNQITQKMLDKIDIPLPNKDILYGLSSILRQADKSKYYELTA